MKRILIILVVLLVLGGVGYYCVNKFVLADEEQQVQAGAPQAVPVTTLTLQPQRISVSQTLPGRISAFKQAEIRPQLSGIITKRLFEEGTEVEQGQQLYQIDDAPYVAALASAKANLQSAQASVKSVQAKADRYEKLVKIAAVSKQDYDDIIAQLDEVNAAVAVAQANVDVAQVNLDYTKVYAPIAGRIGKSTVTEGALVTANQAQAIATITQLDPVYVDINQPGVDAMAVRSALAKGVKIPVDVVLDSDAPEMKPHQGYLQFSDVTIDESTGSIGLRALVPNPDKMLLPGLFVHAKLNMGEQDVILVPQRATARGITGEINVWIVGEGNTVSARTFTVRDAYQDQWIVENGLSAGEVIVVEGRQKMANGATVAPTPWNPSDQAEADSSKAKE